MSGLDLGDVIALVSTRAQQLTRASGAVVELAEGDEMVYRATSGIAAQHLGLRLKRKNSLSGLCVAEGRPLCCDDSDTDDRVDRTACRKIGLRSMIVVPLRHHDVVVGVLKVMAGAPHAFDDSDVHILGLMSDLIAAAMFHAAKTSELFIQATHDAMTGPIERCSTSACDTAWRSRSAKRAAAASSASTWTASNRSTTNSVIASATPHYANSPRASNGPPATPTPSRVSAVTNSA